MKQHTAYSYVRFSTPEQARGDSLRRQTEAAADWCRRNSITLDTSTTFRDLGKSAFLGDHRSNPERHRLAVFLKMVQDGEIASGSYLILENLDRLSREHIQPALSLALDLMRAGIRIVQLKPAEMVFDKRSDMLQVMMMMMELARGHGESAVKSERVGAAWKQKKELARQGKPQGGRGTVAGMRCLTHVLPSWIQERGGTLHLIPDRAAVVKRMFHLAAAGHSPSSIAKMFRVENIPAFGRSGRWMRTYIALILADRRALGEYQPGNRTKKLDGPPIAGYFPAVVSEQEWHASRANVGQRIPRTRLTDHVNLFAGLLVDARDGKLGYIRHGEGAKSKTPVLINQSYNEGLAPAISFPLGAFETAVLGALTEIDPRDIIGGKAEPDESAALEGERLHIESKIAELEAALLEGNVASIAKVLRQQEERLKEVTAKLAEARQKAAHPLSQSWSEAQTLAGILDEADNVMDVRVRIRAALRRIIESICLLIVPLPSKFKRRPSRKGKRPGTSSHRFAVAQFFFVGGARRDIVIHYRYAGNGRASGIQGKPISMRWDGGKKTPELDLRNPDHVKRLEKLLLAMDVEAAVE